MGNVVCFYMCSVLHECIADEITQNLKFEEKNGKWKVLEHPFREIHKIFGEEEAYIRHCMETKDWWAKAIALWHNTIVLYTQLALLHACCN